MISLKTGDLAPDFTLPDHHNKLRSLSEFRGQRVLLYFYPRDFTPGCTQEACGLRDNFLNFQKLHLTILGISTDTPDRHLQFINKHHLPFILLSDQQAQVAQQYGVWRQKTFAGKKYFGITRTSFLIDSQGHIIKIYSKVNPSLHANQVLTDLQQQNL